MESSMRNKVRTVWLKGVGAIVLCALPVLAQHGSSTVVNPYTGPEHEQAGAKLFRAQCAGCHGPDGTGTGAGASLASGTFRTRRFRRGAVPHDLKGRAGHLRCRRFHSAACRFGSSSLTSAHLQSRTAQAKSRVILKPAPRFFARTVPAVMRLRARAGSAAPTSRRSARRRS